MNFTFNSSHAAGKFAEQLGQMMKERRDKEAEWTCDMMKQGIAATHPDDGWIDRRKNELTLMYPRIVGELKPGALVALGDFEEYKIVRLIRYLPCFLGGKGSWSFEEVK